MQPPAAKVQRKAAVSNGDRSLEFAIAESGDVLFKVTASGELGRIPHADARALHELLNRWRT